MPRKQRFKPSRKPKPVDIPTTEQTSNQPGPGTGKHDDSPGADRPRVDPGDIETGSALRPGNVVDETP